MTATEKRRETMRLKKEQAEQRKADWARTVAALKAIRDDPEASPSERLRAIELLHQYRML